MTRRRPRRDSPPRRSPRRDSPPPQRRDRDAFLRAQRRALSEAEAEEDYIVLSAPRLTKFPPLREILIPTEYASASLARIEERDLREGEVHCGRCLEVTTISDPSVSCSMISVVAEDGSGSALRLVIHYFTSERTLAGAARLLPKGSQVLIREPYFQNFPIGGFAVCCAQPDNLEIRVPGVISESQGFEALMASAQFASALQLVESSSGADGHANGQLLQARALEALGRYRDAAHILLRLQTFESIQKAGAMMKRAQEKETGDFDFLALHKADASNPTRFPCASYFHPRVAIMETADRGKGVFAREALSVGELVMGSKAEHIIFNCDLSGKRLRRVPGWDEDGEDSTADTLLMRDLAEGVLMSAERRERLLGLSCGEGDAVPGQGDAALLRLLHVVKTNRFTANQPWDGGVAGTGLWLEPSRLNHACDANCSWCNIGDMMFVRCQRNVAIGEELTIPYCNPTDSRELRREFLNNRHGFLCNCNLCEMQCDGKAGACSYERDVEMAEAREAQDKPDYVQALAHRSSAFEFLAGSQLYCSQRQAQTEHAMHANAACHKLGRHREAQSWLLAAKEAFALQWGDQPGVFNLYAYHCGVIGVDVS